MGVGAVHFFWEKRYEGVWFNAISVTRAGGGQISRGKRYVTLEWPQHGLSCHHTTVCSDVTYCHVIHGCADIRVGDAHEQTFVSDIWAKTFLQNCPVLTQPVVNYSYFAMRFR